MEQYKTCRSCNESKPVLDFYKQCNSNDGLRVSCKKCFNVVRKRSYQKNKTKAAEYGNLYRLTNQEKIKSAQAQWRINNKEKAMIGVHLRRARLRDAKRFTVTKADVKKIMSNNCLYCGKPSEHLDHIVPISRGGLHSVGNFAPSCANCNRSKSNKFITEWKKVRGW
jgi:5-methylcytosine-specific restriction endonuclease McrA